MTTPYSEEFDMLPMEEIRRLLLRHRKPRPIGGNLRYENEITFVDIEREVAISRTALRWMMDGKDFRKLKNTAYFGKKRQTRLSRWLIKEACGMIVKRDGKIVHLNEPTRPMPIVRRVSLGLTGPTLTKGVQIAEPRAMPKFMDIFKVAPTIQLPKGLR